MSDRSIRRGLCERYLDGSRGGILGEKGDEGASDEGEGKSRGAMDEEVSVDGKSYANV